MAAAAAGEAAPRRVVITGMGVVSSLGHDPAEFYGNLLAGKSGISLIENFDASEAPLAACLPGGRPRVVGTASAWGLGPGRCCWVRVGQRRR